VWEKPFDTLVSVFPDSSEAYLSHEPGGRRFALQNGQSWAIGRGDGCPVLLDSRSVSRLHALIQRKDAGDFQVVDLGSRNGSFLNGRRVSTPALLRDSDRLLFGDQELVFRTRAPVGAALSGTMADSRNAPTTALHSSRLATILVVDIRDYTPLARTVSEGLLSQTIGTWFLRAGHIVQRLGSWAQKYIGDAVMAVWVHDDPARLRQDLLAALQAAAEIEAASTEIGRTLPLPSQLRVGAGVNTGPAILSGADYTALGDAVNAAFRLEAATRTLNVGMAVGDPSYRELRLADPAPFQRREVALKGYESPSTAWAVSFDELRTFLTTAK
jgi:adenylate cyclase